MSSGPDPALTVGLALALGITAQVMARAVNIPGIVLLLLFGVVVGPDGAGLIQPDSLGDGLHAMVGLAVSVILFEGGMSLNVRRVRQAAKPIRRLITTGALLTALLAMLLVRFVLDWRWKTCLLFGTLSMVTGPTVINPLLRRIRVSSSVHTVLAAEGILVDAVGALAAVFALELVLPAEHGGLLLTGLAGLGRRWLVGLAVGMAGGGLVGLLLRRRAVPEELGNAFTLAFAAAIFTVSNALASESGIVAAIAAGMIVGNMGVEAQRELMEFKEQLSVLLVGLLFIILAADVRVSAVISLGWRGVLVVAALMLVVRPLAVLASTTGTGLGKRERAFLGWLAPRGIVAAAVASLFAERMDATGLPGGSQLRSLVFLMIAMTVVIQGGTGGVVARWLGVARQTDRGVAFLGADAFARVLARLCRDAGEEVVLVDLNAQHCREAEEEGFKVIFGNALEERTLARAQVEARRFCVAATHNEGVNLLFARTLRRYFRGRPAFVLVQRGHLGVRKEDVEASQAEVIFGRPIDAGAWTARAERKEIRAGSFRAAGPDAPARLASAPDGLLPFTHKGEGGPLGGFGSATVLRPGDEVTFLIAADREAEARAWLAANGFEPVPEAKVAPAAPEGPVRAQDPAREG